MDDIFKALADTTRRSLLDRLHIRNGQTLSELCTESDMTRQAVTKHLQILEEAALIIVVWRGREKLHYLNPLPIQEIHDRWLSKYDQQRAKSLADLKKALAQHRKE